VSYTAGKSTGSLFVVRDGQAHKLEVKLGADNGSLVEVLSGLQANDSIVVSSSSPLRDGIEVDTGDASNPASRL
jgi:multidrug efflux pump subunit AcrA (membrane-fusion protein)